ncbi:hypothetical protein KSF81_05745 [Siccirubricoccus sp. G192]|nr:hypothetical protein [Siccirubricoccus sp. G192]
MRPAGLLGALAALALLGAAAPAAAQQQQQPLRLVMNTELQVLDPVFTPSVVTRTFGYMVWDTLVGVDSHGEAKPQMLESWQISDDRLTWTFKLRPGLEWHDGAPVTAEDCVLSIRRWGARDGLGRQLMAAARGLRVVDEKTFVLELARPFGQVLEALGKASTLVPFMMPARIAQTPPNQQIQEVVGSGPFLFRREEWRPGDRVVFHRNPRYRPREEPADGLAGGKQVHLERAEFVSIPDHSTKVAALQAGEIDYLERAPLDFIQPLRRDRRVVVTQGLGGGADLRGADAQPYPAALQRRADPPRAAKGDPAAGSRRGARPAARHGAGAVPDALHVRRPLRNRCRDRAAARYRPGAGPRPAARGRLQQRAGGGAALAGFRADRPDRPGRDGADAPRRLQPRCPHDGLEQRRAAPHQAGAGGAGRLERDAPGLDRLRHGEPDRQSGDGLQLRQCLSGLVVRPRPGATAGAIRRRERLRAAAGDRGPAPGPRA